VLFFLHLVFDKVQDQNHVLNVEFHLDIHVYLDQFVELFLNVHLLNIEIVVEEFVIVFLINQFLLENFDFFLHILFLIEQIFDEIDFDLK